MKNIKYFNKTIKQISRDIFNNISEDNYEKEKVIQLFKLNIYLIIFIQI